MHARSGTLGAMLALAGVAHGECITHSATLQTHLIELYTSEGCSSCPPADAWLRTLGAGADAVPLEFHVDYWDSLGWPDRYDDPRFTGRQRDLALRSRNGIVYTPEVALDGHEWRWGGAMPRATRQAPTRLTLHVAPGNPLRASLLATPIAGTNASEWRAFFAVSQNGLATAVGAGENRGATLHHDHTVRAFAGPLPLQASADGWTARTSLALPHDFVAAHGTVVAFVQNPANGSIAQVVHQPLPTCTR